MGWAPVILIFSRMYALKARIYLSLGQRPRLLMRRAGGAKRDDPYSN